MSGLLGVPAKRSTLPFRFRVVVVVGLVLAALGATERSANADEELRRRTPTGREVLLRGFAEFNADCTLRHVQTITVVDAPVRGRVEQRPGTVTIGDNWVGSKSCAGAKLEGMNVYYVPDADYVGHDRLSFDVAYASHRTVHATVDVTVHAASKGDPEAP